MAQPIGSSYYEPEFVTVESEGECRLCHKWAVLGNGLCMKCWDRHSFSTKVLKERFEKCYS